MYNFVNGVIATTLNCPMSPIHTTQKRFPLCALKHDMKLSVWENRISYSIVVSTESGVMCGGRPLHPIQLWVSFNRTRMTGWLNKFKREGYVGPACVEVHNEPSSSAANNSTSLAFVSRRVLEYTVPI
jgi:hypothetical protein